MIGEAAAGSRPAAESPALSQRTTRALSLTEEGRLFFEACGRILTELEEAERSMRDRIATPAGLLRVELPAALGRLRIVPALGMLIRPCRRSVQSGT